MSKSIKAIAIFVLCAWIAAGNLVRAAEPNTTDEELIKAIEEEILENDQSDEIVAITTEKIIENNFSSKEYEIQGENKNNYLVEGGNDKAINTLATQQNIANATLIENVNVQGEPYDMEILDAAAYESKEPLELRQFISFETKSGKIFHLIIDHSKNGDNVMMLTEVGEQDLLNMIEEQAEVELELSAKQQDIEGASEEKPAEEKPTEELENNIKVDEDTAVSSETSKKEINTDLIIIIAVAVLGGIGGWYFKIFKPKREALYNDEVDEADYLEDEDYAEDSEYLDDDEQL